MRVMIDLWTPLMVFGAAVFALGAGMDNRWICMASAFALGALLFLVMSA